MFEELKDSNPKILVIGDIILDEYHYGAVERISPESIAPVYRYEYKQSMLGGAGYVSNCLSYLTNNITLCTVLGNDYGGLKIRERLHSIGVNCNLVFTDRNRKTTVKKRLIAQNNQHVIRIDNEDLQEIKESIENQIIDAIEMEIHKYDLVLVSDYSKGFLTKSLMQNIIMLCNKLSKNILIDTKTKEGSKFIGAYLIKPNLQELAQLVNRNINSEEETIDAIRELKTKLKVANVLVTCGPEGMILLDNHNRIHSYQSAAKEVVDVTGAGDSAFAYLGWAIASGANISKAAEIANVAAGFNVGKIGTEPVRLRELKKFITNDLYNKILVEKDLDIIMEEDKCVVFTNGCFDLLHVGHIRFLKKAAQLGDLLIVAVNSDNSVRRLKGHQRPIVTESERMEMLSSLSCVDYVIKFHEDTPAKLIEAIKPNIIVKGGDYTPEHVVGKEIVAENGGKVVIIQAKEKKSTSDLISYILRQSKIM